jgi:FkbM family methyltransferase
MRLINRLGNALPKWLQRSLSDSRITLPLLERIGREQRAQATSPEATTLVYSPLFHEYLFRDGGLETYEPQLRNAFAAVGRPGMVAYDIGANVGTFTLQLAQLVGPTGHVYSFEPDPSNFAFLQDTVRTNNLSHVTPINSAIAAESGRATFDRRGGAFSGRLVAGNTTYHRTQNTISVLVASIDDLVRGGNIRPPDIVKIDVEGNEALVLRGMRHTLLANRPVVACEIHTYLGDAAAEVEAELRRAGYQWRELGTARRERQILATPESH